MSYQLELSRLLKIKPATIAITVVGGTLACVAYFYIKRILDERPPKKWKKVGEISDIFCYPIKSCGSIRHDDFECQQIGLQKGQLRDRTFMVVRANGEFITARAHPKMVQIASRFEGDTMIISAPGMRDLSVDVARLLTISPIKANVWGQIVDAVDAGEDAACWFSRYIFQEDFGLRLVFYPQSIPTREARASNKVLPTVIDSDTGALHDATSFSMINEGSVAELNSRIKDPVTARQFRPNFVVKGPGAFDEDHWKWVKIGDEVVFRNVKPLTRCIFVNIDPESAERNPDHQPLKTLKSYRMKPKMGDSPVMGIHLGLRQQGNVKLGDAVYVEAS